jgi:hypothetical protein
VCRGFESLLRYQWKLLRKFAFANQLDALIGLSVDTVLIPRGQFERLSVVFSSETAENNPSSFDRRNGQKLGCHSLQTLDATVEAVDRAAVVIAHIKARPSPSAFSESYEPER